VNVNTTDATAGATALLLPASVNKCMEFLRDLPFGFAPKTKAI